jgi:opacity protein-like surface antigen
MNWKSVLFTLSMIALTGAAFAQEQKSQVNVEGIAAITNSTNSLILPYSATAGGGFLAGYRYNLSPRFALEGDYALTRNTQNLFNVLNFNTGLGVQTNVHELTGAAVFTPGGSHRVRPYLLAGGGALFFRPNNGSVNTLLGIANDLGVSVNETRPAFLYGGGVDFGLTRSLALRAEYRGLVFRAPGLNLSGFNIPGLSSLGLGSPSFTHMAQPAIGLVWRF